MKKTWITLFFISFYGLQIQAQDTITFKIPRLRVGIEAGWSFLSGGISKPEQIRENRSYYFDDDFDSHCGFAYNETNSNLFYLGIKPEYTLNKRFMISLGVRFSFNKITLSSDRNYFLWKVSESETSANYIKIKKISRDYYHIGIPIEIKFFPSGNDYFVRQYFTWGMAFNFLAGSTGDISFQNPAMSKYSSDVLKKIEKPSVFQCSIYAGVGLKIGRMSHPFGNIEILFPVVVFGSDKPNSLSMSSAIGFGLRTTLQIPVLRNHQLIYND